MMIAFFRYEPTEKSRVIDPKLQQDMRSARLYLRAQGTENALAEREQYH